MLCRTVPSKAVSVTSNGLSPSQALDALLGGNQRFPGERLTKPVLRYLTTGVSAGMNLPDAADRKLRTVRVVDAS